VTGSPAPTGEIVGAGVGLGAHSVTSGIAGRAANRIDCGGDVNAAEGSGGRS
jgi:hypothetical protein